MEELEHALNTPTHHQKVFQSVTKLTQIRRAQPAFHPNATQYILHMGENLFAFWRQSLDRRQSLFAVYNMTDQPQHFNLSELNLIATDDWTDLVSEQVYEDRLGKVTLMPYQFVWLANKKGKIKSSV
jgi:sucrose phosphorylase